MADALTGNKRERAMQLRRAGRHTSNRFSIVQMLSVLELVLHDESDIVYFDHVGFHCQLYEFAMQQAEIIGKYEVPKCGKRCCLDSPLGSPFE